MVIGNPCSQFVRVYYLPFGRYLIPKVADSQSGEYTSRMNETSRQGTPLRKNPWLTFLLPFVVFMLAGSLDPTPDRPGGGAIGLAIPYAYYPWLYAAKIALTVAAVAFVWPGYQQFPFRLSLLAIVVGVVGGPLWIGLCHLDCEHRYLLPLLERVGMGGFIGPATGSAFNPLHELAAHSAWAWTFLAVRFLGLVAIVPLMEEFSCVGS